MQIGIDTSSGGDFTGAVLSSLRSKDEVNAVLAYHQAQLSAQASMMSSAITGSTINGNFVTPSGDRLFENIRTKLSLDYKGLRFVAFVNKVCVEFFEDPENVTYEEMQILMMTHPVDANIIKDEWGKVWLKDLAEKEFLKPY